MKKFLDLQEISYEQMEFLGDSLLGCIISSYLYRRYVDIHNLNEGFLTKIKIKLIFMMIISY